MDSNSRRRSTWTVSSSSVGFRQGRLTCGDALRLRHAVGDELVLFAVGVGRPAILADRQGVDQGCGGCTLHRLEQRGEKGGQLIAGTLKAAHLAQVDRQFIEQDQGRLAAEQLAQGLSSGCDTALVAIADALVSLRRLPGRRRSPPRAYRPVRHRP